MIHFFATHLALDVVAVWFGLLVLSCLFVSGAALMHSDTETYGTLDEPELARVYRFPRRPVACDDPPECPDFVNGFDRGWVS